MEEVNQQVHSSGQEIQSSNQQISELRREYQSLEIELQSQISMVSKGVCFRDTGCMCHQNKQRLVMPRIYSICRERGAGLLHHQRHAFLFCVDLLFLHQNELDLPHSRNHCIFSSICR